MATLEVGKLYVPESASVLRDDLLTDFRLEARKADVTEPAVTPGTDNWFFFTAVANAGMLQYANIATIRPSITPLDAVGEDLERWRIALGLPVVSASPSSGKLTVTVSPGVSITVPAGLQFVFPNGLRGEVVGAHLGVTDGADISVRAIDKGSATNAKSGTKVRFVNPPLNLATEARVSIAGPLTGGYDDESEPRKRERVLNRLANSPGGGNWGQLREIAFNALPSVQDCYVYPAAGGPSSEKIAVVREFDPERNDWHRAMPEGGVALVRDAIQKSNSGSIESVVDSVEEESADVAMYLTLPDSSLAGGNGLGWVDQAPWPPAGSGTHVTVTAVASTTQITVNAATTTSPIAGLHHITWWAPGDQTPRTVLITGKSGGTGAWVLTLDVPLLDSDGASVAVGDYISPAAVGIGAYRDTFLRLFGSLGAGELVDPLSGDTPRRLRHPFISDGAAIGITGKFRDSFIRSHPEIEDGEFSYLPTSTPTVPNDPDELPRVLVPRNFGIYLTP
jgi:uncharacterized phage protein gp47/JayE